jgi:hypothetical protein
MPGDLNLLRFQPTSPRVTRGDGMSDHSLEKVSMRPSVKLLTLLAGFQLAQFGIISIVI